MHQWPKGMVLYAQPTELLQRLQDAVKNPPSEALVIAHVAPQLPEAEAVTALLAEIAQTCTGTVMAGAPPACSEFLRLNGYDHLSLFERRDEYRQRILGVLEESE